MFKLKLHWQIVIAMVIGVFTGYLFYRPVDSIDTTLEYALADLVKKDMIDNEFIDDFRQEIQTTDRFADIFPSDAVGLTDYELLNVYVNYNDSLITDYENQYKSIIKNYESLENPRDLITEMGPSSYLEDPPYYTIAQQILKDARSKQDYERKIYNKSGEFYIDFNQNGIWDESGIVDFYARELLDSPYAVDFSIFYPLESGSSTEKFLYNYYLVTNNKPDHLVMDYINTVKQNHYIENYSSKWIWDSIGSEIYYDFNNNGVYDAPVGDNKVFSFIESLGVIFVRLLKMIIIPLIFTSIITGVSGISNGKKLGRLGIKTIGYYVLTSMCAIIIGLTLTNLIQPGKGMPMGSGSYDHSKIQTDRSVGDILIDMIPTNPIAAMAEGDMLSIIFFAIFLGVVITQLPNNYRDKLRSLFMALFEGVMIMTKFIIMLAPIGVFGLITKTVATSGFEMFSRLGFYMFTIFAGLSIHILIVLPLIFFLLTRINPIYHFKAMASAMATAFSTSSSSATLPVTMKCVKENAKISDETSSFVLPMGATVNMDGTALYECAGVIFIAQVLGVDLSVAEQFTVVIVALLASIGAAGVPSAGLVMIFIVTQAVGFENDQVAVIIGSMLAVDRPLDMLRTMVNIFSDSVGAAVIAKSEGEKLYNS